MLLARLYGTIWTSFRYRLPQHAVFCLAALLLLSSPDCISALAQPPCTENSQWTALIQKGGNQRLPAAVREQAYQKALTLCPGGPAAYDDLAILLLQHQDYRAALHWIHQGMAVAPHDSGLTLDLGVALLSTGQPEAALQTLQALPGTAKEEFYLGMAYRALREHEAARQAFSKSFVMGDSDPYVLYELIEQDRALHDEKRGLRDFQIFYERFPHSAWLHLLLGNAHISRNDSTGAEAEYRQAARLDPSLPMVHFDLGRLAFNRGGYFEAFRDFQTEIAVDPAFGEAYLYAGTSLRRLGKNQEAIPYLEQAVGRDPNNALAYRELAVAQVQARQGQAARRTLQEGERRFPKEPAFPAQLARILRESGNVREADEQSRLAETLSRQSNVLLGTHAKAFNALRAPRSSSSQSAALQQLRECVARKDARCASQALSQIDRASLASNAEYLNLKAEALNLARQEKPALAAVQRAIELDPHRADFLVTRGRIEQRIGNQRAAIKSFLYAEQMQPGDEAPVYYLGMSFFMLGYANNDNTYYDRAAQHFKAALELDPRDDRAEFMLGVVDSIEFKVVEANKDLEKALKMNPNNPYYHLHYGMLLSRTGHLAEGEREMELAEKLDPSYGQTYLRLGDVEAQMGKYYRARAQLEAAVRLDPHLPSAYYTLGRVYYRLGLREKSREALQKFQEMKSQQQNDVDPIGAAINAVASRR